MDEEILSAKFFDRIVVVGECWVWKGGLQTKGYGNFYIGNSKKIAAHRFSFLLHKGEIPGGYLVCHHCDNPPCVNPDHLFVGTNIDNVNDAISKGRFIKKHPSVGSYQTGRCRCNECRETYRVYRRKLYSEGKIKSYRKRFQ